MSTHEVTQAVAAAPLNAAVTTAQVFATATNALTAAILSALGSKRLEAKRFTVRASGTVTSAGAATTFSPLLAVGSSLNPANNTAIAQAAGVVVNTTTAPWWLEANLIFDSTSGKLQGTFSSCVNNSLGATAALSTVITGLNSASEPPIQFVTGGTFSAAAAGNVITLSEFVLEQ